MKNIALNIVALLFLSLASCNSDNNNQTSEIVQYPRVNEKPLDSTVEPVSLTNHRIDVPVKEEKPVARGSKKVNQKPQKSIQELTNEIVQLEEQGGLDVENADTYYTYGDALLDMEKYDEALEMYQAAQERGYKDLKNLYFKIAKVYALKGDYYGSVEDNLRSAREEGFRNYRALLYDAAFKDWRADYDFMYLYSDLFKNNKKAMFKAFVTLAPKERLMKDYVISLEDLLENTNYEHRKKTNYYQKRPIINVHFEDFVEGVSDEMFSREGGDNYRYELLLEQEEYFAVVYSVEQQWSEYILPKTYHLVTYDLKGNKISELELARRGSLKTCKGFVLHPDYSLVVNKYQVEWKADAKDNSSETEEYLNYKDIKTNKLISTQGYQITNAGRIVEVEVVALIGM